MLLVIFGMLSVAETWTRMRLTGCGSSMWGIS
jgi:hypothetical protein